MERNDHTGGIGLRDKVGPGRSVPCPACGKIPMTNGPACGTDSIWASAV